MRAMPTTTWPRSWRRRWRGSAFPAVLHCFTGGPRARPARARSRPLRLVLRHSDLQELRRRCARSRAIVPLDRLLVETDAPFLAPGKYRGKAQRAGLRGGDGQGARQGEGHPAGRAGAATTDNFFRLFSKTPRSGAGGMSMRFTILGCGSSGGVPRIGDIWGNCDPANPRNRRRRCSLLVERFGKGGATTVLVDTPPDLREQLLGGGVVHARRRALHARACRPHPRHRRPARLRSSMPGGASTSMPTPARSAR